MSQHDPRLPAILDSAVHQLHTTLATVADRALETLQGLATSAHRIADRDDLLDGRLALVRQAALFRSTFASALRTAIADELAPRAGTARRNQGTDWQSLSLVDDAQIETDMAIARIAQQIAHGCEWELRELGAYMGTLLMLGRADEARNPLRASVVGGALWRAIEALTPHDATRKLLVKEVGTLLAQALPEAYRSILADIKSRGLQPASLSVRGVEGPGQQLGGVITGYDTLTRDPFRSTGAPAGHFDAGGTLGLDTHGGAPITGSGYAGSGYPSGAGGGYSGGGGGTARGGAGGGGYSSTSGEAVTATGTLRGPASRLSGWPAGSTRGGAGLSDSAGLGSSGARSRSQVDAELMALLRRINFLTAPPEGSIPGSFGPGQAVTASPGSGTGWPAAADDPGAGSLHAMARFGEVSGPSGPRALMAANLIRTHEDELKRASAGGLDHLVIEVVGSLFDQILSDNRVPPQMARQIARLQLPVLRVALADPSFFSSRKHPVRRFVNRVASLACAYDDFSDGPGRQMLERVRALVQEIVDGDFDQLDLYAAKLAELELFTAQQAESEVEQNAAAATLLETKESELRVQQRYMAQLQGALGPVPIPGFLRDFITQVWSQSLATVARREGPASESAQRYRLTGRQLVMSVQPKGSPPQRQKFLMQLPQLMKDLRDGLDLIGWPQEAQQQFFAQLMPSHAQALKGPPMSELDHNLLVKQVDSIFNAPVPRIEDTPRSDLLPTLTDEVIAPRFSEAEAAQVGLVNEQQVDWDGTVDIDLNDLEEQIAATTQPPPASDLGLDINLDLIDAEPPEPVRGASLIDHLKIGFAYQMHLKDQWQKVRLSYISPGRAFFVFTHGKKHQETLSMTSRMLQRVCEAGRLKAFENTYLIERATQRARRQLAALKAGTDTPATVS
jgi:hypothetical protein